MAISCFQTAYNIDVIIYFTVVRCTFKPPFALTQLLVSQTAIL